MKFSVDIQVSESGRSKRSYTLESDLNGEMTLSELLEFTKNSLIATAYEVLRDEQARGFDKNPVVTVDNRVGKPAAAVHPLGQIEFTSRANVDQLIIDTYEGLLGRSPVLTGDYKKSHLVYYNRRLVAASLEDVRAWLAEKPNFGGNDSIQFINIQPYGRKLERLGVTAGRQQARTSKRKDKRSGETKIRLNQPNGTYYLTARAIKAKYKRNSSVRFEFVSGAILGLMASFKKPGRRGKNSAGRPYLYPSITILLNERGIE